MTQTAVENIVQILVRVTQSCLTLCHPHGLYSPRNSPDQNTGVGGLSFFQGIFPNQGSNSGLPHCRRILYQLSHKGSSSTNTAIIDTIINYNSGACSRERWAHRPPEPWTTWLENDKPETSWLLKRLRNVTRQWLTPASLSFPFKKPNSDSKGAWL